MQYELSELRSLVTDLVEDLEAQVDRHADIDAGLTAAWQEAVDKSRTGEELEAWREDYLTQVAVAWVLTSVFVRFLEDNRLARGTWIAGAGRAGEDARDRTDAYFREHPTDSETDYLLHVFAHFAGLRAGELFGRRRNPLYHIAPSGAGGRALLQFWRATDPDTNALKRDFAANGASADTRFLGDLYQDLSEHAKKRYALLQTPDFVESYILDYTLEPAIETFGLDTVRFIDPTCGSGHFLLGGFHRILAAKLAARPGVPRIDLVREALEATYGVDLNPFAVAIARFRLLIAAMTAVSKDLQLDDLPALPLHIAVGDTLLHGRRFERFISSATGEIAQLEIDRFKWNPERWGTEDNDLIDHILGQQYHAVVGNPPYITPKDTAARDTYRKLYASCHRQYALVCPFYERFFELAGGERLGQDLFSGERWTGREAGYVGMIVANSFMKREFGSKLIEEVIPHTELTHVIDTSGAYIPGHGTPTVILFGRNRARSADEVRAVLGIRGEPQPPADPTQGKVWRSIADHTNDRDFENDFITVSDLDAELMHTHPWSLRGGGALEGKTCLETGTQPLDDFVADVGFGAVTRLDDAFVIGAATSERNKITQTKQYVTGENCRNWQIQNTETAIWPYSESTLDATDIDGAVAHYLWRLRVPLSSRVAYGKSQIERGLKWFEYSMFFVERFRTPLTITYAFVATHNHFVLDRGGKVFNRHAPVIKLPADATEDDHLELLGLLNSSTACFWMQQVFFNKGGPGGGSSKDEKWNDFYEFDGTKIKQFPLTEQRPLELTRRLDALAQDLSAVQPSAFAARSVPTAALLDEARAEDERLVARMVALQEELDWRCYELYGLLEAGEAPLAADLDDLPEVHLGGRAFEVVMARKMEAGELDTKWFTKHGSAPVTAVSERWPAWYRELVQRRIDLIASRRFLRLIEQPEYKRRWNRDSWEARERDALRGWLLDRLESPAYVPQADRDAAPPPPPRVVRVAELADRARDDADFIAVAERYTHNPNVRVDTLVADLLAPECVPFLPAQRYKKGGIKKRRQWEKVWDLQRREDAGEKVKIPKPPKYTQADFKNAAIYKLRGKLDVPKERFTSYPGLEHDGNAVVTWAGFDHQQRAQALATYYYEARQQLGFSTEQLTLILAGIADLVPWVKQWHNDLDPEFGIRFGDYLEDFVAQQAAELGVGLDAVQQARIEAK